MYIEEACGRAVDGSAACRDACRLMTSWIRAAGVNRSHPGFLRFQLYLLYHNTSFIAFMKFFTRLSCDPTMKSTPFPAVKFFVHTNGLISHTQCINWYDNFYVYNTTLRQMDVVILHESFTHTYWVSLNIHNMCLFS